MCTSNIWPSLRGWPEPEQGVVDYPLPGARDNGPRREARTDYQRLATVEVPIALGRYPQQRYALVLAEPETGRFRQIRKHLAHIHHPVIGDCSTGVVITTGSTSNISVAIACCCMPGACVFATPSATSPWNCKRPSTRRTTDCWRASAGACRPAKLRGMLPVSPSIVLPESELVVRFLRADGPGGQHVNRTESAVELRFDVLHSPSLPDDVRARLLVRRDRRLTDEGVLVIQARRFRDQGRNREDARERLVEIVRSALTASQETRCDKAHSRLAAPSPGRQAAASETQTKPIAFLEPRVSEPILPPVPAQAPRINSRFWPWLMRTLLLPLRLAPAGTAAQFAQADHHRRTRIHPIGMVCGA